MRGSQESIFRKTASRIQNRATLTRKEWEGGSADAEESAYAERSQSRRKRLEDRGFRGGLLDGKIFGTKRKYETGFRRGMVHNRLMCWSLGRDSIPRPAAFLAFVTRRPLSGHVDLPG